MDLEPLFDVLLLLSYWLLGGITILADAHKVLRIPYFLTFLLALGISTVLYNTPEYWGDGGPTVYFAMRAGFGFISALGNGALLLYVLLFINKCEQASSKEGSR